MLPKFTNLSTKEIWCAFAKNTKINHKFFSWENFFGSELLQPTEISSSFIGSQQPSLEQNYAWISKCYFHQMSSESTGGAISYSVTGGKFLVESSLFNNCSARTNGGAIYLSFGDCVINKVCGYQCSAIYESFCDIYQSSETKEKNFVHESSIASCNASLQYTMHHDKGYIEAVSLNLSHNQAKSHSAFACVPSLTSDTNTYGTIITYSSFTNNNATNQYCLYFSFYNSANNFLINNSNILSNPSKNTIFKIAG